MVRVQLSEGLWSKIDAFLRSERGAGRPGYDDRKFVEAVLWWRRKGVPWRDLPSEFRVVQSSLRIECTFSLLKHARRFATRYDKTLRNYGAVVALGCALLWLRI